MQSVIRLLVIGVGLHMLILFGSNAALAGGQDHCTEWVAQRGVSCVYAGNTAYSWERVCADETRICKWRRYEVCDKEHVCWNQDPNFLTECSEWVKERGVSCINRESRRSEQKWTRACVKGNLQETFCSNSDPNLSSLNQ